MKTNSDKKTNEEVKNCCKYVIYTFIFSLIGLLVELIYCSTIGEKGFTNLSDMLVDISNRLNGLSFSFNSETSNVEISYDDGK